MSRELARVPDASLHYDAGFLPRADADRLLAAVRREVDWQQREIFLFGRRCLQPRLLAWLGDPGVSYTYSCTTLEPSAWTPAVREIRARVLEAAARRGFATFRANGVLCNLYRDGRDSMGWHSDDERELGPDPVIASVSLGTKRRFVLRRRDDRRRRVELELEHGSLLWMAGPTQRYWQHALPRSARVAGERINLTFRELTPGPR